MAPRAYGLAVWGLTDVGQRRSENQDTFLALHFGPDSDADPTRVGPEDESKASESEYPLWLGPSGALLLVADGMGGTAGGAIASQLAAKTVARSLERSWPMRGGGTPGEFGSCIRAAIEEANERVLTRAAGEQELRGMGTTLTCVGVLRDQLVCAQVGDSRAYIFRAGQLKQITRDQTVVQEMLESGALSADEARRSDHRGVILQAVGSTPELDIVLSYHDLADGDRILLCSDGLSGVVEDAHLAEGLASAESVREACEVLVGRANGAGGPDNITVLLGHVRENGAALEGGRP